MKFVRQRDSMQCGASCLKMICDEYKGSYSYEELSELCSVTSEGVSMLGIIRLPNKLDSFLNAVEFHRSNWSIVYCHVFYIGIKNISLFYISMIKKENFILLILARGWSNINRRNLKSIGCQQKLMERAMALPCF